MFRYLPVIPKRSTQHHTKSLHPVQWYTTIPSATTLIVQRQQGNCTVRKFLSILGNFSSRIVRDNAENIPNMPKVNLWNPHYCPVYKLPQLEWIWLLCNGVIYSSRLYHRVIALNTQSRYEIKRNEHYSAKEPSIGCWFVRMTFLLDVGCRNGDSCAV